MRASAASSPTSLASTAARSSTAWREGAEREVIPASLTSHVANKLEGLGEGLALSLGDNGRFMLNDLLEEHDALEARIASYTKKIDEQMAPWEEQLRLLTTIPGIGRIAASTILIEIGPDIEVFASKEHFAAWVGLCPGNNESVNGGAKLVHPGGAKLVHLTLCGTRCWGVVPVVHRRDPRCLV